MTNEEKRVLRLFQSEENRLKEQNFARGFTGHDSVTLAFINEGRAFTDGKNITVDPAMDRIFADKEAMAQTSKTLGLKETVNDPWSGLYFTSRALEIHECLHIIFTQFPIPAIYDKRSTDRLRFCVLAMIGNIIEDAFIENAGASEFPETEVFLRWGRVSRLFAKSPSKGTLKETLEEVKSSQQVSDDTETAIEAILDYCAVKLLYPMAVAGVPDERYEGYISTVLPLFFDGSVCGAPEKRHEFSCRIFDVLEPLLPESIPEFERLQQMLGSCDTHNGGSRSINEHRSQGRKADITRRLFLDKDGRLIPFDESGSIITALKSSIKDEYSDLAGSAETVMQPVCIDIDPASTGASAMHRAIKIKEYHPIPDALNEKSYKQLVGQYQRIINNYKRRFDKIIHTENEYSETKQYFGTGISSRNLTDSKKRYWYKHIREQGSPELSVMLMIDGSGSMSGARRNAAVHAAAVLTEVLESKNIEHCIVEYRALYDEPVTEHNILVDFRHNTKGRYNIMRLSAYSGTREGLSLCWAEKYFMSNSQVENKVMIVISDGFPAHECEESDYLPPVSTQDTANAVKRISHRGVSVIAIALGYDCYPYLKEIYPKTVLCTELDKLTGQLLKMIADELHN